MSAFDRTISEGLRRGAYVLLSKCGLIPSPRDELIRLPLHFPADTHFTASQTASLPGYGRNGLNPVRPPLSDTRRSLCRYCVQMSPFRLQRTTEVLHVCIPLCLFQLLLDVSSVFHPLLIQPPSADLPPGDGSRGWCTSAASSPTLFNTTLPTRLITRCKLISVACSLLLSSEFKVCGESFEWS